MIRKSAQRFSEKIMRKTITERRFVSKFLEAGKGIRGGIAN